MTRRNQPLELPITDGRKDVETDPNYTYIKSFAFKSNRQIIISKLDKKNLKIMTSFKPLQKGKKTHTLKQKLFNIVS